MQITKEDVARSKKYDETEPKQLGNLHERMQYVMQLWPENFGESANNALHHALWDLQTEVSYHAPADPPYGRRKARPRQ